MPLSREPIERYTFGCTRDEDDELYGYDDDDELNLEAHIQGRLSTELTALLRSSTEGLSQRERAYFIKGLLAPFNAIKEALEERNTALGITGTLEFGLDPVNLEDWLVMALFFARESVEAAAIDAGFEDLIG
jgi:hypothetical protein